MSKKDNFKWKIGEPLPQIEKHSKTKLLIFKDYLDTYFKTYFVKHTNLPKSKFSDLTITLVDGFCGGGIYKDKQNGVEVIGSPLIMLDAVKEAESKVNLNRDNNNKIKINAKFIFIDSNLDHINYLDDLLKKRDYDCTNLEIINSKFKDQLMYIMKKIKIHSNRVRRSIFFLDQWGYTDVPMYSLKYLFKASNSNDQVEVIWTFAIDHLLGFIRNDGNFNRNLIQYGVDQPFVDLWNERKKLSEINSMNYGRAYMQEKLINTMSKLTGSLFFTPFFFKSQAGNKWMLLSHLSSHFTARSKMLEIHWANHSIFCHYGRGSLFSLNHNFKVTENQKELFEFDPNALLKMQEELKNDLPKKIYEILYSTSEDRVPIKHVLNHISNITAATNEHLLSVLQVLSKREEIIIQNKNGYSKRSGSIVDLNCFIKKSSQTFFDY